MKIRLWLLSLLAFASQAKAEILTIDSAFSIIESDAYYKLSLSTGGYNETNPRITGYIPVTISFDTETLQVIEFRIKEGAKLEWSSFSFSIYTNIRYDNIGTVFTNVSMNYQNLEVQVSEKNGPVRINPETGEMNTDDLQLLANSGSISFALDIEGTSESETLDFQQTPTELPITQAPVLKIERIKDDIHGYQYDISFELTSDETAAERLEGTNLTLNTIENVRLVAKLSHEKESNFGRWYRFNQYHYDGDQLDSKSPTGIPMYMAFALGHEHYQSSHQKPFYFTTYENVTYFNVISPFRREDIKIEFSTDLSTDSWQPIPADWLPQGPDALLAGSRKNINVIIPQDGPSTFLRVVTTTPQTSN